MPDELVDPCESVYGYGPVSAPEGVAAAEVVAWVLVGDEFAAFEYAGAAAVAYPDP